MQLVKYFKENVDIIKMSLVEVVQLGVVKKLFGYNDMFGSFMYQQSNFFIKNNK